MTQMRRRWDARPVMLLISLLVIVLDRISKLWVQKHVGMGHAIVVIPNVFRITHVLNTGAAFSMFEGAKSANTVRFFLIGFSVIAAIAVSIALWRLGKQVSVTAVSLALIFGGAIGNLYDRVRFAHVTDFLEVRIVHYHWPDFNVADSAIVVGACLLLLEMLRPQKGS